MGDEEAQFTVNDRSVLLIRARAGTTHIAFGTTAIGGRLQVLVEEETFSPAPPPRAHLLVDLRTLRSGNAVYDLELAQHLDLRQFPHLRVDMTTMRPAGGTWYEIAGQATLHGITHSITGVVDVQRRPDGTLHIAGNQDFDIRDFAIPPPRVSHVQIEPRFRVHLSLTMAPAESRPVAEWEDLVASTLGP